MRKLSILITFCIFHCCAGFFPDRFIEFSFGKTVGNLAASVYPRKTMRGTPESKTISLATLAPNMF